MNVLGWRSTVTCLISEAIQLDIVTCSDSSCRSVNVTGPPLQRLLWSFSFLYVVTEGRSDGTLPGESLAWHSMWR